jgi:D-methionine transport system substrate-binding protein
MLQRTFDDVDLGFLFAGIASEGGFDPLKGAIALEDVRDTPYKGIVAIRKDLVGSPKVKALQNAFASEALKTFTTKKFGGSIVFLEDLNK